MTAIQRLKECKHDQLGPRDVAEVLGLSLGLVYDLVGNGSLECTATRGMGNNSRARMEAAGRANHRYSFTRYQILSYIIKATRGDRITLMAEIEIVFPKWLPLAERIAKQHDARSTHKQAEMPLNIIDGEFQKPRKHHDAFAGVPEMFPIEELTKQPA